MGMCALCKFSVRACLLVLLPHSERTWLADPACSQPKDAFAAAAANAVQALSEGGRPSGAMSGRLSHMVNSVMVGAARSLSMIGVANQVGGMTAKAG
jgi:hypothetical protein